MRALVSTSRMPSAVDEIRKLGQEGHHVVATDTFETAPGNHSRYVGSARVTASPRNDTARFIRDVAQLVKEESIDIVLPAFEEVFYLAKLRSKLPPCQYFFPPFETLERLHDKGKLQSIARDAGVPVPQSTVVRSRAALADAAHSFEHYFAKPIFSRGGVDLLTNRGPLAGALALEDCAPTGELPWIVQEYVEGTDVCTFSVVQRGRVTAHTTYVHPREIEHAGGIVFESIEDPEAVGVARSISELLGYHGQLSLDFIRTSRGLVLIECNPRPTAGVHLMSSTMFVEALLDRSGDELRVVAPGVQKKYSIALVRDMLLHPREAREDARYLLSSVPDAIAVAGDLLPAFYQVLSYGHVLSYRRHGGGEASAHRNTRLMAAYFDDVCWNGEPIQAPTTHGRASATRGADPS